MTVMTRESRFQASGRAKALARFAAAAALAAMLALAVGCSQSGQAASSSPKPAVNQVGALFAMEPAELADYLESQGMTYLSIDEIRNTGDQGVYAVEDASQGLMLYLANAWHRTDYVDAWLSKMKRDDKAEELMNAVEESLNGGYLYGVSVLGRDYLDDLLSDSIPTPDEAGMNSGAITASYRLSPQQLRSGEPYYLLRLSIDGVIDYGYCKDNITARINEAGLPEPTEVAVFASKKSGGEYAYVYGFFEAGGQECFYRGFATNSPNCSIEVCTLEDAYKASSCNSKDALIQAHLQKLAENSDRVE